MSVGECEERVRGESEGREKEDFGNIRNKKKYLKIEYLGS